MAHFHKNPTGPIVWFAYLQSIEFCSMLFTDWSKLIGPHDVFELKVAKNKKTCFAISKFDYVFGSNCRWWLVGFNKEEIAWKGNDTWSSTFLRPCRFRSSTLVTRKPFGCWNVWPRGISFLFGRPMEWPMVGNRWPCHSTARPRLGTWLFGCHYFKSVLRSLVLRMLLMLNGMHSIQVLI